MEKGKSRKEKRIFTIVLVPNSPDKLKVLKITGIRSKLLVSAAFILVLLACLGVYVSVILSDNSRLKSENQALSDLSSEQNKMLKEKVTEIDELKEKEANKSNIDGKIRDLIDKYRAIADNYTSNGLSTKSSRSGTRIDRNFVEDINELKTLISSLEEAQSKDSDTYMDLSETENKLKAYIDSTPSLFPTPGRISSDFGGRRDPFRLTKRFHTGIDIAAPYGQNINAAASGEVTLASRTSVYGNTIIIDHGHGISTMYGHTSKILVKKGQKVKKGDVIARVGSTGRSTGAHLHFEVRVNGTSVDPLKYVDNN